MSRRPRSKVLVADESTVVASRLAALIVESIDVEIVGPAHDGVQAVHLFHLTRPEAVVLDVALPRLGGVEVVREIRATGRSCVVVVLTSRVEPSIRELCLEAGADHFLRKASEFERAVDVVIAHLERQHG